MLNIQVIDNGCGIKPEDQQKLFKLFGYLEESQSLNTRGVGLGLYITQMIVAQFGGKVSVESVEGRGSTFFLSFELSDQRALVQGHSRNLNQQIYWSGVQVKLALPQRDSHHINRRPLFSLPHPRQSQSIDFSIGLISDQQPINNENIQPEIELVPSKILVIDDEPFNLHSLGVVIKLTLQQLGFRGISLDTVLDFAQDGKQAVDIVQESI